MPSGSGPPIAPEAEWRSPGHSPPSEAEPDINQRDTVSAALPHTRACRAAAAFALLAAGLLLGGCAGTARGKDTSVYTSTGEVQAAPAPASEAIASVVIRYPAIIHADAEPLFISSFAVNAIGGEVPYAQYGKPHTARIAQSVIAKSGYYAMSLYRELRRLLPPGRVLLSPHLIVWDEQRGLHSRPIIASEQVPSVLTVDFNVYSFPDINEMMDSPPVTFGDLVTPLLVVRSSRWARPSLNGLLIASEPLAGAAWRQSEAAVEAQLRARLEGRPEAWSPALDFIRFLGERDRTAAGPPGSSPGAGGGRRVLLEQYPVEKIQLEAALVARLTEDPGIDPFTRGFVRGASARILELLNEIEPQRATFFARQSALARFDPELADVLFLGATDESVRARLQLGEALIAAEREFLSAQSESVYTGTFEGDFGIKMRKIIEAEYRMLEERRRLARVQNVTGAVAALALAGSVYGATVSTTASAATVAALSGVSLLSSVWAMNRSMDARTESEDVSAYFIARMAPAFERQMSVQMEWLESKEVITARGFAEFRNKTLTLYQSRVRSLQQRTDPHCLFRHPDVGANGRWYGRCAGGLATGRGYGVLVGPGGASVEYVGQAAAGLADGAGFMIRRANGAAQAIEGGFAAGRAHGVVRIEEAGAPPRLREYRAGQDVGRGDAGRLQTVAFAPPPADTRGLK